GAHGCPLLLNHAQAGIALPSRWEVRLRNIVKPALRVLEAHKALLKGRSSRIGLPKLLTQISVVADQFRFAVCQQRAQRIAYARDLIFVKAFVEEFSSLFQLRV